MIDYNEEIWIELNRRITYFGSDGGHYHEYEFGIVIGEPRGENRADMTFRRFKCTWKSISYRDELPEIKPADEENPDKLLAAERRHIQHLVAAAVMGLTMDQYQVESFRFHINQNMVSLFD